MVAGMGVGGAALLVFGWYLYRADPYRKYERPIGRAGVILLFLAGASIPAAGALALAAWGMLGGLAGIAEQVANAANTAAAGSR